MLSINEKQIRPVIAIDIDQYKENDEIDLSKINEPFLFIRKQKQIVGYVQLNNIIQGNDKKKNIAISKITSSVQSIHSVCSISGQVSLTDLFQIIGEPISIVKEDEDMPIGYILREDILAELFKQDNKSVVLLKSILTSIPMGTFVVDKNKVIINCNDAGLKMIKSTSEKVINTKAETIFSGEQIDNVFSTSKTILNQIQVNDDMGILVDYSPIFVDNEVEGVVIVVQDLPMVEEMASEIEYVKDLNKDLNAILSSIYDEILVVNHKGELIRYSENIIPGFWNVDLKELLGKSILEFENQGLFTPSVTKLVLEKKKKVSIVQETINGRKVLAVGNPVFDEKGEIERIIIASRDITETSRLKTELKEMKKISEQYKKELEDIKSKDRFVKKLIYCSPKMEQIINQAKKIADFSSTVLLHGESGVGKEVIAQAIHQLGNRSSKPFLKLNCGAIPENLLESELFGYIKGAFTGADQNKDGYFKQADEGVLFLDEIGEMPLHLQVKLLRVLQEQEVIPVGSTKPIKVNVQIIAATNKRLEKMVEERTFREDLYYRLNVIPLNIPPLRERIEDISLLAFSFLQQLNEKYNKSFHLTPDAINVLEFYSWPGNVRELQNIIERLVVSAEDQIINAEDVNQFLPNSYDFNKSKPVINKVIPLQEAIDYVEEQLIVLAMKQYKTTTKAAQVLGISQSSVSRKYQKIMNEKNMNSDFMSFK